MFCYLLKHHWKKGAAILAGILISLVVGIITALIFIELPSDLGISLLLLIVIIYPILRFMILDNTYVPADGSQGMGYQEGHEIELMECPNCGFKNYASTKTCLRCGFDLKANAPVRDEDTKTPIGTANPYDPFSVDVGLAPDPDRYELDEVDRRSAAFISITILILGILAGLIYFITT
jgi:ribosomal protein L37E